jgi:hypothetical protein
MKHLYPVKNPDAGPLRPEYQIAAPFELTEPVDAWTFTVFPGLKRNSANYKVISCLSIDWQIIIILSERIALILYKTVLDKICAPCLSLAIGRREC